jgi:hypothetical protein
MNQHENNVKCALGKWVDGTASVEELRSLAMDIGTCLFMPGIPALMKLLDHADGIVRYNAASSLAHNFVYEPATDRVLVMLAADDDGECRSIAASCLASLCHDTQNRRVLAPLAQAALHDPEEYVRESAYRSLLVVNGLPEQERLRVLLSSRLPIDPVRIDAILKGKSGGPILSRTLRKDGNH